MAILLVLAILVQVDESQTAPAPVPMQEGDVTATQRLDLDKPCASTSLYVLLRLSGREVNLADIMKLVPSDRTGVSADDLCRAAESFGIRLKVVQLDETDLLGLSKPFIVFQNPCDGVGTGVGHYAAARVLADGEQVQFIDPPRKPMVLRRSELFNPDNRWARIVFVQEPSQSKKIVATIFVAGTAGISLLLLVTKLQRKRSPGRVRASVSVRGVQSPRGLP